MGFVPTLLDFFYAFNIIYFKTTFVKGFTYFFAYLHKFEILSIICMHCVLGWIITLTLEVFIWKKYLIDASIIASSLEDFKRRFISSESTLILSDLTFRELEARKKDRSCELESVGFARFLIDLFVKNIESTEICLVDSTNSTKHIDESLVKYALDNNLSVLTCDKGMALWCRFYGVNFVLLETRSIVKLPFIHEDRNAVYLNLYDRSIPRAHSVYVYSPIRNCIISPLDKDKGTIFLNPGYVLLVAHPENNACCIDTYHITKDRTLNLVSKDIYSCEDDIETEAKPFHRELYTKWVNYTNKLANY